MYDIPRSQVLHRIRLENPWWQAPYEIPELISRLTPRPYLDLFQPLVTNRDVRRAVVLMGPRRVGKTVLLHHCIRALLNQNVRPSHICYLSIDNPVYNKLSLEALLSLYGHAVNLPVTKESVYIFFDEIQYLPDWERHLKSLVDSFPGIKCIASGSAAAALRLKSTESGAGRLTDFLLPPLTFYEYLLLLDRKDLVREEEREGKRWYSTDDIDALNDEFESYLNFGGYPEAAFSEEIQKNPGIFIKSDIVDKVLLRDLPSLYGITNVQELNSLFTSLAFNSSGEVSLENLCQGSGIAKPTISKYIEYLEAAFLLRVVRRVDENARRFQRQRNFKVYLSNPSIRTALFGTLGQDDEEFGSFVETGVFAQWFHSPPPLLLHYARWSKGEIDILRIHPDQTIDRAVEVKWSDRYVTREKELAEAIQFCSQNNVSRLVVTTRTKVRRTKISNVELHFWPAALYTYAVGLDAIDRLSRSDQVPREF